MARTARETQADTTLGETLVARKRLTAKQLERIRQQQSESGSSFTTLLIEAGLATDGIAEVVAELEGIPYVDLSVTEPDSGVVALITGSIAREHTVVPVKYNGDRLVLAMSDPSDDAALNDVAAYSGLVVEPVVAGRDAILKALDSAYGPEPRMDADAEGSQKIGQRLGVGDDEPAVDIHDLLEQVMLRGASDLHLTNGIPPALRVHGDLVHMEEFPVFTVTDLQKLIYGMLTQKQRERLENELELDFSYSLPGKARFRVNVYIQKASLGAAFRLIPFLIRPLKELGIPKQVEQFAKLPRGLVLVTGPTGSGKSTTLASLIDMINREQAVHIMTVEDPIEFLHAHKKAIVNQREVGADTHGFAPALKHVLRQDPDVILVGEMRDLETIQMAITAAETGHLVFGTLHTQDAPSTVDRIIDVFPPHQQNQIRVQLASSLQGVVAQQLLQTIDGESRVAAIEVLFVTSAIRNLIREAKTHQIYSIMQAGAQHGMLTMDDSLAALVKQGKVSFESALEKAHAVEEFTRVAGGPRLPGAKAAMKTRVVS